MSSLRHVTADASIKRVHPLMSALHEAARRAPELICLALVVWMFLRHLDAHDASMRAVLTSQAEATQQLASRIEELNGSLRVLMDRSVR